MYLYFRKFSVTVVIRMNQHEPCTVDHGHEINIDKLIQFAQWMNTNTHTWSQITLTYRHADKDTKNSSLMWFPLVSRRSSRRPRQSRLTFRIKTVVLLLLHLRLQCPKHWFLRQLKLGKRGPKRRRLFSLVGLVGKLRMILGSSIYSLYNLISKAGRHHYRCWNWGIGSAL